MKNAAVFAVVGTKVSICVTPFSAIHIQLYEKL
jgi:hypothetical protein